MTSKIQPPFGTAPAAKKKTLYVAIILAHSGSKIAEAFGERQLHTQSALDDFTAMLNDTREATERYRETGLSMEGFAAYWFLCGREVVEAEATGRRMGEAFDRFPHWRADPKQEQSVRLELYKALMAGAVTAGSKDMVDEILTNLRRSRTSHDYY